MPRALAPVTLLLLSTCLVSSGCDDAQTEGESKHEPGVVKSGLGGPGFGLNPSPKVKVQPKAQPNKGLIGEDGNQQIVAPNQLQGQDGLIGEDGSQQIVAPNQLQGQDGLIGEDGIKAAK